jgi:hypothetical protein
MEEGGEGGEGGRKREGRGSERLLASDIVDAILYPRHAHAHRHSIVSVPGIESSHSTHTHTYTNIYMHPRGTHPRPRAGGPAGVWFCSGGIAIVVQLHGEDTTMRNASTPEEPSA